MPRRDNNAFHVCTKPCALPAIRNAHTSGAEPLALHYSRVPRILSLRGHLSLVLVCAVVPSALLAGLLVWRTLDANRAVGERRLLDTARVDADALDREFDASVRLLQTLAASPALDAGDLRTFYDEARRASRAQRAWAFVILASPDGRQLIHTAIPFGQPLSGVNDLDSLQRLVAGRRPVVGTLLAGRRDPTRRFAIRVPVERGGALRYALTAVVEPGSLAGVVSSRLPATEEWTRTVLDPNWTIVARTRDAERFIGQHASPTTIAVLSGAPDTILHQTTLDGERVYAAVARSAYGWRTAVAVPVQVLDAPIRSSLITLLASGLLLIVAGLASVWIVSRKLSRDLAAQVERAQVAQAEAEEANRTKDQFLAALGHELRNPLAPALTAIELMKLRGGDLLARERQVLERQISHMTRLVDDLLDVSRLSRGIVELRRRRFELRAAVERAVDMARPTIDRHAHQLTIDVAASGLPLDADDDRITQVLVNLLTNAAKYTPDGGHLALRATAADGAVEIACDDDGPGIPPELLPKLFDPFTQGPRSLDRRAGGLGLGLALARRFTEVHGGAIRVEPRHPRGSRFVVRLPLAAAEPMPLAAATLAAPIAPSPKRVLVVDDNVDAREMLLTALQQAGHDVRAAANAGEAIGAAAVFVPEVAVLDIGLPDVDGYALAGLLRRDHPGLRLVALTGYGQPRDRSASRRAGFDAHLAKPVTVAALLACIDSASASLAAT
jgi:signal transduction histidine kinase/CheY-like chemotaxis protein